MADGKDDKIKINPSQQGLNPAFSSLLSGVDTSQLREGVDAPPQKGTRKKGRVTLHRETAHRGGKTVIIVRDFESFISAGEIEKLGSSLRKACGCGGTVKNRDIEIQGEHAEKIRTFLRTEGFQVAGL